jgi:hypothetical protein
METALQNQTTPENNGVEKNNSNKMPESGRKIFSHPIELNGMESASELVKKSLYKYLNGKINEKQNSTIVFSAQTYFSIEKEIQAHKLIPEIIENHTIKLRNHFHTVVNNFMTVLKSKLGDNNFNYVLKDYKDYSAKIDSDIESSKKDLLAQIKKKTGISIRDNFSSDLDTTCEFIKAIMTALPLSKRIEVVNDLAEINIIDPSFIINKEIDIK